MMPTTFFLEKRFCPGFVWTHSYLNSYLASECRFPLSEPYVHPMI